MIKNLSFFVFSLLLITVSCRIKNPSLQEQEKLIQDGAFPGGVPPWVVTSSHPEINRNYSGTIPNRFSSVNREQQRTLGERQDKEPEQNKEQQAEVAQSPTQAIDSSVKQPRGHISNSPIQRINEVCPGIEGPVSEAVVTEDSAERLVKYKSLVAQCNRSDDLWFWLGKEYLTEGNMQEAKNCFEQVLILNREHREAAGLLNQIRGMVTTQKTNNR